MQKNSPLVLSFWKNQNLIFPVFSVSIFNKIARLEQYSQTVTHIFAHIGLLASFNLPCPYLAPQTETSSLSTARFLEMLQEACLVKLMFFILLFCSVAYPTI